MNQILSTKLEKNNNNLKKRNWFQFQFTFSICIIILGVVSTSFYLYYLREKEKTSHLLMANYHVYQLYNNSEIDANKKIANNLLGIIEIQKINLYYPVFSHITEDLLKISPCKFYGTTPDMNGNICIAGHNYDNNLFFSKIATLSNNDKISLFDHEGKEYVYWVYDLYEVSDSDLSPIFDYEENEKILTLVTCNNLNSNRIILRAKQKKLLQ